MLEAQFGSQIAPIERPRIPPSALANSVVAGESTATSTAASEPTPTTEAEGKHEDESDLGEMEMVELARLQALGIPVPGIEIRVDKNVVRVWLEDLEVECANAVLRDRVRVVVERAVETVAGMWSDEGPLTASVPAGNAPKMTELEGRA